MSDENDQAEPKVDQTAPLSIIDLIIQEQMEKDALVLAPKPIPPPKEPEAEPVEVVEEPEQVEVPSSSLEGPQTEDRTARDEPAAEKELPAEQPSSEPEIVDEPPSRQQPSREPDDEPPAQVASSASQPELIEEPVTAPLISAEEEEDEFELTEEERAELEEWGLELTEEELAELAEYERLEAENEVVEASTSATNETTEFLLGPSLEVESDVIELFQPAEPLAVGPPTAQVEQLGASSDNLEDEIFELFEPVGKEQAKASEEGLVTEPVVELPEVTTEPAAPTQPLTPPPAPPSQPALQSLEPVLPPPAPELSEEARPQILPSSSKAVGGQLRELEQRLTKRLPPAGLPEEIKKRSSAAMQYLATFAGIERGVVAVLQGEEWQVTAVGNVEREYLEKVPQRILKSVLRTGEPLLLLDATKDARYRQDPVVIGQGIKSALCVRFRDGVTGLQGVLYADNLERPNAFTYQELRGAEWFAQRLENDPVLQEYQTTTAEVTKAEPETLQTEPVRTDPRLYLLVAVAMVLLVFPALSNPTKPEPKPAVTPVAVERVTTDPKVVVLGFLRALETKNHRSAYNYLSSARKSQVEEESFREAVRKFVTEKDNAWVISRLSILEDSHASGKTRSYKLIKPDQTLAWRISVQEAEGSWYVSQIKGMNELSF